MTVKWNPAAVEQLEKIVYYISEESVKNALKVENAILLNINALTKNPEIHPPDKYKIDNDGSFRAFEIYHYRISYRISKNAIRIIRIRHTKRNPLNY